MAKFLKVHSVHSVYLCWLRRRLRVASAYGSEEVVIVFSTLTVTMELSTLLVKVLSLTIDLVGNVDLWPLS